MVVGHHRTPYVNIDPFPSPNLSVLSRAPIHITLVLLSTYILIYLSPGNGPYGTLPPNIYWTLLSLLLTFFSSPMAAPLSRVRLLTPTQ